MKSKIANDLLKVFIDGHCEPQVVPKLLLQVSIRELYNRMTSTPEEGGLKEARYADNNIIMSDSILRSILSPQLNNMSARYNVVCGCEWCISAKSIHS